MEINLEYVLDSIPPNRSIEPFQLSYPGLDHLIHVLRARAEDLAQDLLSCLEFLGHYVYWLDVLAHKDDLLDKLETFLVINVTQINETAYLFVLQPAGSLSSVPGSFLATDVCETRYPTSKCDCPMDTCLGCAPCGNLILGGHHAVVVTTTNAVLMDTTIAGRSA